ncbi:CAAX amino terminal protease self- immunity [Maioricimonas rarisocia]|uniref:CAAX amino terminal protease self-immunity n=1 Tax=Maioricimonas rarisocia TaxID=2528026 RepID=A0A517Z9H9_9PLAN|nr:CPBP family intramembrane glutamic endopeptidase [Maioricimonas rarisocia]QDU39138.1 CAAX amino terminal protease self- immunity [Maioricimonas rarisocia]
MSPPLDFNTRRHFLNVAGLVEGGLVLVALLLAALLGMRPLDAIHWQMGDVGWGILAIAPMLLLYVLLGDLRDLVVDLLGRPLSRLYWYDLMLVAAMAGFGEELLFRGVLQPWLAQFNATFGLIATNVLFGLAHAVTPVYALFATGVGFYMSWLADHPGGRNLLRPILAHALYDWIALVHIVWLYRRRRPFPPSTSSEPPVPLSDSPKEPDESPPADDHD